MHPFFYILLLLPLTSCQETIWKAEVTTTEDPMLVGIFKQFTLTLSYDPLPIHRSKAGFRVIPEIDGIQLKMSTPVNVDTHKSYEYIFYVGMSKTTDVEHGKKLTLSFEFFNEDTVFEKFEDKDDFAKPNTVEIEISREKVEVYAGISYPYLPIGSWILFYFMENIYNVDPIKFSMKLYIGDGLSFEDKEFPPFTRVHQSTDESWSGKIYADDYARAGIRVFDMELENDSPYYIRSPQMEVEVTKGGIAEMSSFEREEMMKTIELIDVGEINRISLQFKVISFPTMITCLCQKSGEFFPDDDDYIRNFTIYPNYEEYEQDQNRKIFQRFIINQEYHTITFNEMSRLGRFKIKCLIDNTSVQNRKTFSFTAGNFKGADIKMVLMNEKNAPIFPNCLTYKFKETITYEEYELLSKSIDYSSNDIFTNYVHLLLGQNGTNYNWTKAGCFIWNRRDLVDLPETAISFCLEAVENCNSVFPYNSTELVQTFVGSINTDENLKANMTIPSRLTLDEIILETDNAPPNITLINGRFLAADEQKVYIQVINNANQSVVCNYNKADKLAMRDVTVEDILGYHTIFLNANETRYDVEIPLEKEGFTERMYGVMVVCMNNPGASYSSHYTIPFPIVVYYNRRGINPKEYNPSDKVECDKIPNPYDIPECLTEIHSHKIPEYEGIYKRENNTEDSELFYLMPNAHQIQLLDDEIDFMSLATDLVSYLDDMSYIGEMLGERNCHYSFNYDLCREHKQNVYEYIYSQFKEAFTPYNYLSMLRISTINKVRTVKAFVETLFYLTNNPDSIRSVKQIEFLLDFLETIEINELLDFSEAGLTDRTDIVKVLIASAVNLNDILIYAHADYITHGTVDPLTGVLIEDNLVMNQKYLVNRMLSYFWELGETYFHYDSFSFYLHTKLDNPSHFQENRLLYEDDWTIHAKFPKLNVNVDFRHSLLNKYNGFYIHAYAFEHYPFIKMGTPTVYHKFVGLEMYAEDGNYIDVSDIDEKFRVNISYYDIDRINTTFHNCLMFDDQKMKLTSDNTEFMKLTKHSIQCTISKFGDISFGHKSASNFNKKDNTILLGILGILGIALIVVVIYAIVVFVKKTKKKIIPDQVPDKDSMLETI